MQVYQHRKTKKCVNVTWNGDIAYTEAVISGEQKVLSRDQIDADYTQYYFDSYDVDNRYHEKDHG